MWFDLLMDDCKASLETSNRYHGIYFPVFLKLISTLIMGVFFIGSIVTLISGGVMAGYDNMQGMDIAIHLMKSVGIMGIIGYILYLIVWALIEVGGINLIRAGFQGIKPTKAVFLDGVKTYVRKVVSGEFLIHFVSLVLSPLIIVLFLIFAVVIGIPTGGYGVVFLGVAIGAYFATWTIAIVEDDMDVMEGIGASFRLARAHFKPLFIIVLSASLISQSVVWLLGPLGAFVAGWFLSGVVNIFFKMVAYRTYVRYSEEFEL